MIPIETRVRWYAIAVGVCGVLLVAIKALNLDMGDAVYGALVTAFVGSLVHLADTLKGAAAKRDSLRAEEPSADEAPHVREASRPFRTQGDPQQTAPEIPIDVEESDDERTTLRP